MLLVVGVMCILDVFQVVGEFWLLLPLLSFWSYFMGCIDIYLEKRRGDSVYLVDKLVLVFFTPYVGLMMAPLKFFYAW